MILVSNVTYFYHNDFSIIRSFLLFIALMYKERYNIYGGDGTYISIKYG